MMPGLMPGRPNLNSSLQPLIPARPQPIPRTRAASPRSKPRRWPSLLALPFEQSAAARPPDQARAQEAETGAVTAERELAALRLEQALLARRAHGEQSGRRAYRHARVSSPGRRGRPERLGHLRAGRRDDRHAGGLPARVPCALSGSATAFCVCVARLVSVCGKSPADSPPRAGSGRFFAVLPKTSNGVESQDS